MVAPVELTVFPRLDCCVPDYTGKNRRLGEVLAEVKDLLGELITVEIVSMNTRAERLGYYERLLGTLLAANWALPFSTGSGRLEVYQEASRLMKVGLAPTASLLAELRQYSAYFFQLTPVVALNGKATFVTAIPTAEELCEGVRKAELERHAP